MSIKYTFNSISIANFIDKNDDENEDYFKVDKMDEIFTRFVLCDGAGGSGVFSKEWAQHLAVSTPVNLYDFADKLSDWFQIISKDFHDNVISYKNLSDLFLKKKVYRDGSYSTFCACWLELQENKIHYSVVGDTYLFILKKYGETLTVEKIASVDEENDFNANPELLNWNSEIQPDLPLTSLHLSGDVIIMMASDGLAKWIILNIILLNPDCIEQIGLTAKYQESLSREANLLVKESIAVGSAFKSISEVVLFLKKMSSDKNTFHTSMQFLYTNGEIEIDDYSLIYIEANVSE